MFPCHCFDNTSEVAIAPRTAAIAVLTSQTVAEELDRGLLEDFNGKTPATHANASSSQIAATKHAMEVLLLFLAGSLWFYLLFPLPPFLCPRCYNWSSTIARPARDLCWRHWRKKQRRRRLNDFVWHLWFMHWFLVLRFAFLAAAAVEFKTSLFYYL